MSEVYGLDVFKKYLEGLEDCYAVMGGTACDVIMRDADLDFVITTSSCKMAELRLAG